MSYWPNLIVIAGVIIIMNMITEGKKSLNIKFMIKNVFGAFIIMAAIFLIFSFPSLLIPTQIKAVISKGFSWVIIPFVLYLIIKFQWEVIKDAFRKKDREKK